MRVQLGQKVRDKITGLEGVVIARTEWMFGCIRLNVQPQELKDGRPVEPYVVDEPQVEIMAEFPIIANATPATEAARTYGDRPVASRPAAPTR